MLTQLADESRARRSTLGRGKGLAVADEARARRRDGERTQRGMEGQDEARRVRQGDG
jgi:hypothetical protein